MSAESKIVENMFDDLFSKKYPWYIRAGWWIARHYNDIKYWFKKIYQRFKYGFPLEQSWDFCHWHAKIVVPRLKYMRKNLSGYPSILNDGHDFNHALVDKWGEILDKIIWSFEHFEDNINPIYSDDYDHRYEVTETENGGRMYESMNTTGTIDWTPLEEYKRKIQEGLDLFAKYYVNLWD